MTLCFNPWQLMASVRCRIPQTFEISAVTTTCLAIALLMIFVSPAAPQQGATSNIGTPRPDHARVIEMRVDDQIAPVMAEYIDGGIDQAAREHAALVLITMDTPGGLETSMKDIIHRILTSTVPVAVYVAPTGSRGASAGFFILLSADVAAMAPGTHTGAASPLVAVGGVPLNIDETLKKKILNDATAFLRSYTMKRGRNVALAETAVTEGKAFTESEARDGKMIDIVANSSDELLRQLDDRTITRFDGSTTRLVLKNPERIRVEMSGRQRFLGRIVQPDAFFILLIIGVLGLYAEFTHPGMIAPGVIGAIAMVLALFAMHILPVNFAGLLLIAVALALFVLEAKYTSHGVLALGGIVAMLLGALMLVHSPMTGARVSLGVALGVTAPCAAVTVLLMRLVLGSREWKQSTGIERLIGAHAEVTTAIAAVETATGPAEGAGAAANHPAPQGPFEGMIRLHGELWRAVAHSPIPQGSRVRVDRVTGLTVHVTPANDASARN